MRVVLRVDGEVRVGDAADASGFALAPTQALLAGILETRSLQGAAERLGLSYRSTWSRVAALEAILGQPVVVKTKGHGSVLTPYGAALHAALSASEARLAPHLATERTALGEALVAVQAPARPFRLAASHDTLVLDALTEVPGIELTVAGSVDALARLEAGTADAAGFHYGAEAPGLAPFAALFADPCLTVRPLFAREQGLVLAPGNPHGVRDVRDIARLSLRFVNRQRGAGTRIWFDRLCAEAGLGPDAILGAQTEEFTHQAVAALIAAGAADAGMGTRAVAERFGLAYRPLGRETYFLAMRAGDEPAQLAPFLAALARRAAETSGYAPPSAAESHHSDACE